MYEDNIEYNDEYNDDSEKNLSSFKEILLSFNNEIEKYALCIEDCCLADDFRLLSNCVNLMINRCSDYMDRIDDLRLDCFITQAVENDDS